MSENPAHNRTLGHFPVLFKADIRNVRFGADVKVVEPSNLYECDKYGSRLLVVKQNRFNLPITKLKAAMDNGRFGKTF